MHSRFFLLRIIKANCKISSLTLSCVAKISSSGLFTKSFSFREKSKISSRRHGSLDQFEQNQSWVWQTASSCPNWAWRGQTRVRRAMSSRICTCTCKVEQAGLGSNSSGAENITWHECTKREGNLTTPNGGKESSAPSFTILFSERGSGNRRNLQLLIGILNIYNNKGAVSKRGALKDKVTFLKQFPPNLNINNLKYSRWPSPRLPNSWSNFSRQSSYHKVARIFSPNWY